MCDVKARCGGRPNIHSCLLLVCVIVLCSGFREPARGEDGHWERFPKPPGRADGIWNIGFDESHVLWAWTQYSLYSWQGTEFRKLVVPEFGSRAHIEDLYGGPDRGLYFIRTPTETNPAEVYRLIDGRAVYVTDSLHRSAVDIYSDFYVTKDGHFLNCTKDRVQLYADGQWRQLPVDPNSIPFTIFDLGHTLHLYRSGVLYTIDSSGSVQRRHLRTPKVVVGLEEVSALWGTQRILVYNRDERLLTACDLVSRELIPVDDINAALSPYISPAFLRSGPDGSVWGAFYEKSFRKFFLIRIHPNGRVDPLYQTIDLPWDYPYESTARLLAFDNEESAWIGLPNTGVVRCVDSRISQNDFRQGDGPSTCTKLWTGPDGSVYASSYWLYVHRDGKPAEKTPFEEWPPLQETLDALWQRLPKNGHSYTNAWLVDDFLVCQSERVHQEATIAAIDPGTGTGQFAMDVPYDPSVSMRPWITRGHTDNTMLVLTPGRMRTVNLLSGQTIDDVAFEHDSRIAPLLVEDGYIMPRGWRGHDLMRINTAGEEVWSTKVTDFLRRTPVRCGPLLLAQTPQNGISAYDVDSGRLLWGNHVDAYGCGISVSADGRYIAETACFLSIETTQGWIIGRSPSTGAQLWHYRRPVNGISHPPLADPVREQTYAAFAGGEIVCLDSRSGNVLWEITLPGSVHADSGGIQRPYWPCMAVDGRSLVFIDQSDLIYILDADTGRVAARFDLTGEFTPGGIRLGSAGLVAMPTLIGDLLIVATKKAVRAYSLAGVPNLPPAQKTGQHSKGKGDGR